MMDHPSASPRPSRRRLLAFSCLSCLLLGASQVSALPRVQVDPLPGVLLAQAARPGEQPGSEQQAQETQAPFSELNELLKATRAMLEELVSATAIVAKQRKEIEALKQQTERLAGELEQANTRRTELESSSKLAEERVAELSKALDVAAAETGRRDEELAAVRRQNADLEESLAGAETAREAAEAKAEETRSEMQAKLEAASDAAEQSRTELAGVREELERMSQELATAESAREELAARAGEMEEAVERSGAEAERLKTELAQAKEQLGQAASAAVAAEQARQVASSEADRLRSEAERAREDLAASKSEAERFTTANSELQEQIASLQADWKSGMETARQHLIVIEETIEQLHAALAGAGPVESAPSVGPQAKPASVANEPPTASNLLSGTLRRAAPGPADDVGSEQDADSAVQLAARGPATAPSQSAGLARFDANVGDLNSRVLKLLGWDLFSGIKSAGDGVVHVITTPAWGSIPPAGQQSYLNALFRLWIVAQGRDDPAVVRIVDSSGRVLVQKTGAENDEPNDQD